MTTTLDTTNQQTIDAVTRSITTPSGFRLRIPIARVHPDAVIITGSRYETMWRRAELALNDGHPVRFAAPRGAPRARLGWRFYGRSLTKSVVRALGRLKRFHLEHPESEWAHLRDFGGPRHGDWARLRHWGLIEAKPLAEGAARSASRGWWRLTGMAHAWLRGKETIPRRAAVFDGVFVGFMDVNDRIGPHDVDDEFSFDRLMGGAA